jgi:hypothetical protein
LITFGAVLAAKDMILKSGKSAAGEKRNASAAISGRD